MVDPNNLYDLEDFFRLIIGGVLYYIDEPIGWDGVQITGNRDKDYYGFNYEFIDKNVALTFPTHEGLELIEDVYITDGSDGSVGFEYGYKSGGVFYVQYSGNLNLNTRNLTDEGVKCDIEKTFFEGTLRTRSDTKINFNSLKDLDNNTITIPTPLEISLHSKKIIKEGKIDSGDTFIAPVAALFGNSTDVRDFYLQPDASNAVKQEVDDIYPMQSAITVASPQNFSLAQFIPQEKGNCKIQWTSIFQIRVAKAAGVGSLNKVTYTPIIQIWRSGTKILEYVDSSLIQILLNSSEVNFNVNFTIHTRIDVEKGDEVYFLHHFETEVVGTTGIITDLTSYLGTIWITSQTEAPVSISKGYRIIDVLNHIVKSITGVSNAVISDFFSLGGAGYKYLLCNGFSVRNFDITNNPFQASFKDVIEGSDCLWCLGVQYTQDISTGEPRVKIEPKNNLFGTIVALVIPDLNDYEENHDTSATYNEVEIGYLKYAEDDTNTLDEFNTLHNYLTPISSYKAKYSKKCGFIASGFLIEQVRREQFKVNPSSSLGTDDSIFIIAYVEENLFLEVTYNITKSPNTISFNRPIDLQDGQQIFLTNSASNSTLNIFITNRNYDLPNTYNIQNGNIGPLEDVITEVTELTDLLVVSNSTLKAEKNENFAIVDNLISPETAYNLRISPKRMLYNHSSVINVPLVRKLDTNVIKNTYVKSNGKLITQFVSSEPHKMINDNIPLTEAADVILSDYNDREAICLPEIATFKVDLLYKDLLKLKTSLTGMEIVPENNFGLIQHPDNKGNVWQSYVWAFKYDPYKQVCQFTVKKYKLV